MFRPPLLCLLSAFLWAQDIIPTVSAESIQCGNPSSFSKPRVFILSDILNEPNDSMSLVRLLAYSNQIDIRGLCATTSFFLRNTTHPEEMKKIVNAYGMVVGNLNQHVSADFQFKSSDELLSLVTSGPTVYGMESLNSTLSEGAKLLIEKLEESSDPLHVSLWGGANTLAQTLQHIHAEKSASDAALLRSRLRVYAISDQDGTGTWIQSQWPDIFYISSMHGFLEFGDATWTGVNTNANGLANTTKITDEWITPNIRVGLLGAAYPLIEFNMEGDTPSFLWLIQNGLSATEQPELGGWGGRYSQVVDVDGINWYGNSLDALTLSDGTSYSSIQATIWRWRDAMQDDFAARMQWTLNQSVSAVAHPPLVSVNGSAGPEILRFDLKANQSIILDGESTCDADHPEDLNQLDFEWFEYPAAQVYPPQPSGLFIQPLASPSGTNGVLSLNEAGFANVTLGSKVEVSVEDSAFTDGKEWQVVLQVRTKKGPHPIRRYKRIIITTKA
ncbi:hypothetical protein COL922a_005083 [Colletotrichum nupharicola]|nr:hypothetical protein COL922a_005083 [Colletotrichum nupharicola]